MTAAPSPTATIAVRLLREGRGAWASAIGRRVGPTSFEILRPADYSPDAEAWEFPPGSVVVCDWRRDRGEPNLLAVARAVAPIELRVRPRNVVEFVGGRDPGYAPWIDMLVDGKPLEQIVASAAELPSPKAPDNWQGSDPYELLPPNGSLLGGRGSVQLLVCSGCREEGCDPVTCAIEFFDGDVVWSEFNEGNHATRLSSVGPFVFDRKQYEAAVARATDWDAKQRSTS